MRLNGSSGHHWWLSGNQPACQCRCGFHSWIRKISWRMKWRPILVFLPGNPMDREAWHVTVHGVTKNVEHDLKTKQQR